ncbi:MAG: RNA-binding S4 domain-containing protein [Flavobacteriales bacterium]|nr:RNA-binding S4 domain-containing protein [Flavobacteriia bacterium]NCP05756.1 RNA-binding S4 domain-containing protein [Flavobacteriales bacterium]PIV93598.1 MAG: RNA-binding protein [Flavobacteriaceae bacterium CG17_big_fil_post_rev_8_21_14_2_50_33_15]PIY13056.1 MAG: RNA-binding protein [Flavobacteriaceae bacterium CG_4_10_14_3_um_filter_33_47]PJB16717.1 MAG: RNA-binding protein [Flavobacteriaceae bacterium CG_4_9_14_3_um_filter_33_16]
MRIDKYLWCIRYYKTRTLATTACKKGHVRVNKDIVKPSREIYPQDNIELRKDQVNYQIIVNDIPENRVSSKLVDIYRTDKTAKEQFETQELLKLSRDYYRKKGTGRPSKKDRRDIDNFNDETFIPET